VIADKLALMEAKARYCRLLDTQDWAGYAHLLTEDFVLDITEGTQIPLLRGREAALQQIRASLADTQTVHQIHAPEIELDGDEARVIWALQDRIVRGADRPSMTGYGHYHERWVRANGDWKLAALRLTRLHIDIHPPARS
jgi:hypothetical protein